jgi:F-type H+-transporting ATPase subunit b
MLINWFTVCAQALNFLILVWLLKRFLYKPVLAAIDEREKRIATQLQEAEKKKQAAQQEQSDFAHKNEDIEHQRASLLLEATNAAKTAGEQMMGDARKASDELRSKLEKAAQDEISNLSHKLGMLAQEEVFSIARKTLADLAGIGLEERLTEVFADRLHNLKDKERDEIKSSLQTPSKPLMVQSAFELAGPQRSKIQEALKPFIREGDQIDFEVKPNLVSGIELTANDQRIGWNIDEYLEALTQSAAALLEPKSKTDPVTLKVLPHAA